MSRIIVDINSDKILQVEQTPEVGVPAEFGGRYVVPIPDGTAADLTPASYVLPQDGGDVQVDLAAALLARFPMYANIAYNFLVDANDIDDLDMASTPAVTPPGGWASITRAQTGRGAALPGPTGQVATTTAVLPVNTTMTPNRPGMLITDTIDITAATAGAGADEFLLWWQIYSVDATQDLVSDFGVFAGDNIPVSRRLYETDQEPAGFTVYISHDDGVTWTIIGRLEPTDLTVFDVSVRIAFVNTTGNKYILGAYGVMF